MRFARQCFEMRGGEGRDDPFEPPNERRFVERKIIEHLGEGHRGKLRRAGQARKKAKKAAPEFQRRLLEKRLSILVRKVRAKAPHAEIIIGRTEEVPAEIRHETDARRDTRFDAGTKLTCRFVVSIQLTGPRSHELMLGQPPLVFEKNVI